MAGAPARSSARGAAIGDARRGARRPRFHHCLSAASHPALGVRGCGRPRFLPPGGGPDPAPAPRVAPGGPSYLLPSASPARRTPRRPQPDTPRGPPVSPAASPRHGPGPRLTMAAARHSTLDFMLGAKGEGARPPPAPSLPPPGGLGLAGSGGARAAGRTMRTAARPRPRRWRLPGCRLHRRSRGGRAPAPAALRPGGSAGPGGAAPAPSSTPIGPPSGARVAHPRPTRARPPPPGVPSRPGCRRKSPGGRGPPWGGGRARGPPAGPFPVPRGG